MTELRDSPCVFMMHHPSWEWFTAGGSITTGTRGSGEVKHSPLYFYTYIYAKSPHDGEINSLFWLSRFFLYTISRSPPTSLLLSAERPDSWLCNTSQEGGQRRQRLGGGRGDTALTAGQTEKRGESDWQTDWNKSMGYGGRGVQRVCEMKSETSRLRHKDIFHVWISVPVGSLIHCWETGDMGGQYVVLRLCLCFYLCSHPSKVNITVGMYLCRGNI